MADAGVPPAHSEASSTVADIEIPTNLPSDVGKDYVPLATMLATGELAEADQVRFFLFRTRCKLQSGKFPLPSSYIRNATKREAVVLALSTC